MIQGFISKKQHADESAKEDENMYSYTFDLSFPQYLSGNPEAVIWKTTGFPIKNPRSGSRACFGNDDSKYIFRVYCRLEFLI